MKAQLLSWRISYKLPPAMNLYSVHFIIHYRQEKFSKYLFYQRTSKKFAARMDLSGDFEAELPT